MTAESKPVHTGGCQCGAVRFTLEGAPGQASICHCRMCQKAFGNLFAPLVSLGAAHLRWHGQEPARFQSSSHVRRGFCANCGTPLTYEAPDGLALALGAFDNPAMLVPAVQYGLEGKLPYTDSLAALPGTPTSADAEALPWLSEVRSYQHPDNDQGFDHQQG